MSRIDMRRVIILAAIVALLGVGLGVLHHLRGPDLEISVRPRPPLSLSECRKEVERFGYNPSVLPGGCGKGQGRSWYHAVVRNVGYRGVTSVI